MIYDKKLESKNIYFRAVNKDDANFILKLRLDGNLNKFLNKVSDSVEVQEIWILNQIQKVGDYYFIICDKKNGPIGTIGIYDIDFENKTFNWGRWIITPNAPIYTIIESTLLAYYFGFEVLGLDKALSDVRLGNFKVVNYHLSYNAKIYKIDDLNAYYEYNKNQFVQLKTKYKGLL